MQNYTFLTDYRYERKFAAESLSNLAVEQLIRQHPAAFRPIYFERFINNIYLDTPELSFYQDNLVGSSQRRKYRIRWYGDLFGAIERPVLEIKIKKGMVGTKQSFPLKGFTFDSGFSTTTLNQLFRDSEIDAQVREELRTLVPTLVNRYRRKYFQTLNKSFRITVDRSLEYYQVGSRNSTFLNHQTDHTSLIVELKYSNQMDLEAGSIGSFFPFRMSKSSKYVNGVSLLWGDVEY